MKIDNITRINNIIMNIKIVEKLCKYPKYHQFFFFLFQGPLVLNLFIVVALTEIKVLLPL